MADIQAQLVQLKALYDKGLLSEENYRAALSGLGVDPSSVGGKRSVEKEKRAASWPPESRGGTTGVVEGEGALAQDGGVAAGAGGVAVGRDVHGDVIVVADPERLWLDIRRRPPAAALRKATQGYLTHLIDRYRFLDFRGMGVSDRIPLRLPLMDMYVPLKARVELPDGDTWGRINAPSQHQLAADGSEPVRQRVIEPRPILDLLQRHDGLILLGDPGAGKTTFLKYLTLQLARGRGTGLGLAARLPVLLPLSAYANALASRDIPLDRFIAAYYRDRGVDLPIGSMLDEALEQGGALLLLDGLDEVKDLAQRHLVVQRVVEFFTFEHKRGNKFILTSRIVGYREVRPNVEGLLEATLIDFDGEDIVRFVDRWTAALEQAARGATPQAVQEAARERDELLEAIRRNPGVRRLAANPLLLTILALMKRQGVVLPERRVELYQKYVETLLKNWNLVRGLDRPPSRDLDVVETVRLLAPLALWMHETSPGVGLVKREDVRRRLEKICASRGLSDPEAAARRLLEDVREHAGLLLERGPGEFGFIHLTFQEYLAAVAIALRGQRDVDPVVQALAARVSDDNWHEVTLLAIGYMGIVQQRDEAASDVVWRLIAHSPGEAGRAVVLAGEAVIDAWPGGVTLQCKNKVVQALARTMVAESHVNPRLRAAAGDTLARLGDPRPEATTLDRMEFCWVPHGKFLMGSDSEDKRATLVEKPLHPVTVPHDYWLGRYPITVAQFRDFVETSGLKTDDPQCLRGLDNHPVVRVSWHEARAFCTWLTDIWRRARKLSHDWEVRLPTEAEWEKGARGAFKIPKTPYIAPIRNLVSLRAGREPAPDLVENPSPGRCYPWGDEPDPNRANYSDTNIFGTSAVGCFPSGASPYGCADMSGNVWEWTQSLWGKDFSRPTFRYPYDPTDGRENLMAGDGVRRVLRVGSFIDVHGLARCASRVSGFPDLRGDFIGFRVTVAPVKR
jgi:formylglycine-generating enzyme required for sulfatase activity